MFFYMSKGIKSMTPSSLSPHYAAQSPSGRKPYLVAKEVLEWWQTNGKHPFIQPHISSPSNVGANSPENLSLGDKVQLIRLPVASPSAVKESSQVSSEEPAHLTTATRKVMLPKKPNFILVLRGVTGIDRPVTPDDVIMKRKKMGDSDDAFKNPYDIFKTTL
ncbi:hypothetical protein J3Q64DRAFT_1821274 [Phycomyces blakesleeanus]|uniref:Uncharacterized protein n=2 Tax=Phycomyces blakesleeanus TaxID=4837 RepID=A0A162NM65_PHYB8|nr:hypothetical protein PHYBLDRAFT_166738 [Phycomyces blakesleeanus NRRL 1555(-)]OAD75498.1 hypothetical protein PHYBLDRAFT_166738 [Phycomyces blakesleeanus NRRL 1555(-)]|eukprot:XP_018293538.1 hypothetical protein PHYBLDRAFT_166738 [Phycomyces blakesleeanus NRRL 1555(-)]